jgi:RHS repeat-associated protein
LKRLIVLCLSLALLVGGIVLPSAVLGYVPPDEYGIRVCEPGSQGIPYHYIPTCCQAEIEPSCADYLLYILVNSPDAVHIGACEVMHGYLGTCRLLHWEPKYYVDQYDECHYVVYQVSLSGYAYNPETYDWDEDGTPDAYDDNPDGPLALDNKGFPENTATHNKGNETQGCSKPKPGPGGPGGGMPRLFVNLSTLNFILEDKDIHYFTLGPTIRFARYYNATSSYEGIFGRGWTFSYGIHLIEEASGNVVVVRGTGAEDLFTSQGDGTYTPPKVIYDTLTKNPDDTFTLWVKDEKLTYAFTADGLLTSITDTNDNAVTLSYNANDLLTTITDAAGRTITFAYNANNQVETITDHLNRPITFTYENGDMKTSTDVAGVTTTFNYDADHYLTSMTTPNGTTSFTYQDYAWGTRLATVTDAEGNTTQYSISANDQEVVVIDPEGYTTRYGYNYYGYTTHITDHLGNTTTYEYDTNGNRNKIIDAEEKETSLEHDDHGNITSITNHLNQTTTFVYDERDNLTDMTDPLTRTYHFDYDANDNLTRITDPLTHETEFVYLSSGLLERIIDARNKETSFTYDAHGNLETVTDPLGHTTSFTYYPDSDKMQTSTLPAPLSHTTEYEYDPLGRLTEITHPDATAYIIHRYCSGISGITDENGLYTEYEHDNINQRTKIIHALAGYETEFGYDVNGNLTGLTDPKDQATAFEYYENNRLKRITYPEGAEESYTYNPVGTLATKTDANSVVTTYGYDDLHQLTSITAPGLSIAYTYDAVGNLDTMIDSTGTTDYVYDDLDRLATITYPNTKTIDYTYDAVGNITSIATPFGTVSYSYYANNLLHTITLPNSQQVTYQYDAADNLTRIDYPNGTYTVFAYDTRNRLEAMTNFAPGDTVISTYAYTLDGVGNRTNADLAEPLIPGFDPGSIGYTYDTGNILATADGATYTHDDNGNRVQKVAGGVTVDYTYDSLNRLTQVTDGTQTTQYIYNGLGHRVGKIVDGVQTNYLIDPNGVLPQVLAEMDENNNLIAFYVYDGAGLVAKVTPASEYYFYHYDGLGSTVAITDSSAQIVNAYAYSPYGLVGAQETISNPFTYVGRFGVMAESHGLYYMRARYYDPEVGRFINKDPIGYEGGINLYGYVGGNPTHWVDPLGLFDAFILAEGDLVGIFGIEGGVGIVIDTDALGESGVFRTIGPAVGANAGAAIGGGFVKRDLEGWSYNIDANIKVVSAGAIFDDFGWAGAFGGWGPGIGVSASATHTATYSVNDFIRDIQKLWKKAKSKLNGDATCE